MKKIELKNLTKIFETRAEGGEPVRVVHALDDVSLTFNAGELHALLGENGAGKSTLVKILAGLHEATSGTVSLAQGTSVALVHQHAILCDDLSIFENIILYEPIFWLRKKKLTERVQELMEESSIQLNLRKKVQDTNGLEKFYIEYLVARMRNPDFLILDEPASILSSKDYEAFFTMLKGFCKNGLGIILITHRISEALQWADIISVLQKGQLIFSKSIHDQKITAQELTMVLLGQSKNTESKPHATENPDLEALGGGKLETSELDDGELETDESRDELSSRDAGELPAFRVQNLSAHPYGKSALSNISFSLNTASITAVYGTDAKTLSSLEDALFGMCPLNSGIIFIGNNELHYKNISPTNLRNYKLGYVPSNRSFRASSPDLSLFELICAHRFPTILTHKKELLSFAQHILETEHIDAPLHRKVATLSGGQLQRLILARELSENPNVLILAEPEWGLDIRSSAALRKRLQKIAATGTAILILTENPDSFKDVSFFDAIYELQESGLVQGQVATQGNPLVATQGASKLAQRSDTKGGKHK